MGASLNPGKSSPSVFLLAIERVVVDIRTEDLRVTCSSTLEVQDRQQCEKAYKNLELTLYIGETTYPGSGAWGGLLAGMLTGVDKLRGTCGGSMLFPRRPL